MDEASKNYRRISRKWTFELLMYLFEEGTVSFNQIKKELSPISSRTLARRLRTLKRLHFIRRKERGVFPFKVYYRLSADGREFVRSMRQLLRSFPEQR